MSNVLPNDFQGALDAQYTDEKQLPAGQTEPPVLIAQDTCWSVESDRLASTLAGQYNSHMFVSVVLWSPFYKMTTGPLIAQNPFVRTIGLIVCIVTATAAICALIMRARLFYLRRQGRAGQFAEDYFALMAKRDLAFIHASTALVCSSIILFTIEFLGYVFLSSFPGPYDNEIVPRSIWELEAIGALSALCLMYVGGVLHTALTLGKERESSKTLGPEKA